jgi:hypothetical protein
MEGKFQTSFIPKKPLTARTERLNGGLSIISLIAGMMLALSLALAGGVFLYEGYLVKDIAGKKASFKANEDAFDQNSVSTFSTLNKRINVAQTLLHKHLAPSSVFKVIDEVTLKTVRFSDFNFSFVNDKKITLNMKGQALNYNSVAKQSDVFSENPTSKFIHNPIFADLDLDPKGNVIFSFSGDVDPQQILYSNPDNLPAPDSVNQTQ